MITSTTYEVNNSCRLYKRIFIMYNVLQAYRAEDYYYYYYYCMIIELRIIIIIIIIA